MQIRKSVNFDWLAKLYKIKGKTLLLTLPENSHRMDFIFAVQEF
jgi:hypothetical protein